ncbi:uncharacterized protein LOC118149892 [Callithrix jacchus]
MADLLLGGGLPGDGGPPPRRRAAWRWRTSSSAAGCLGDGGPPMADHLLGDGLPGDGGPPPRRRAAWRWRTTSSAGCLGDGVPPPRRAAWAMAYHLLGGLPGRWRTTSSAGCLAMADLLLGGGLPGDGVPPPRRAAWRWRTSSSAGCLGDGGPPPRRRAAWAMADLLLGGGLPGDGGPPPQRRAASAMADAPPPQSWTVAGSAVLAVKLSIQSVSDRWSLWGWDWPCLSTWLPASDPFFFSSVEWATLSQVFQSPVEKAPGFVCHFVRLRQRAGDSSRFSTQESPGLAPCFSHLFFSCRPPCLPGSPVTL